MKPAKLLDLNSVVSRPYILLFFAQKILHHTLLIDILFFSSMHHDANPSMVMEGHDHHAMMINDLKKRFFITLIFDSPVSILSFR